MRNLASHRTITADTLTVNMYAVWIQDLVPGLFDGWGPGLYMETFPESPPSILLQIARNQYRGEQQQISNSLLINQTTLLENTLLIRPSILIRCVKSLKSVSLNRLKNYVAIIWPGGVIISLCALIPPLSVLCTVEFLTNIQNWQ